MSRILQALPSSKSHAINLFPSSPRSLAHSASLRYPFLLFLTDLGPSNLLTFKRLSSRHRDENTVTATPLESALTNRDAVSLLDSALTKNCRVSYPRSLFFYSLPYTLPSCVWFKSFVCHSYENCRGVHQFFPFWNRTSDEDASPERAQRVEGSLWFFRATARGSLLLASGCQLWTVDCQPPPAWRSRIHGTYLGFCPGDHGL